MYEHVPINHRGVGIDLLLQSCCSQCYVIQPVHHMLHECVVGCPILSSTYEHVPIYHSIVLDSTPSYTLCALTSHHRVRCSSRLKQLAKQHSHVTNTPCKAPKKSRRGRYSFICTCLRVSVSPFLRGHFRRLSFYQFFVRASVDFFVHGQGQRRHLREFQSNETVGFVFECLVFEISWEYARRTQSLENVLEFTRRLRSCEADMTTRSRGEFQCSTFNQSICTLELLRVW